MVQCLNEQLLSISPLKLQLIIPQRPNFRLKDSCLQLQKSIPTIFEFSKAMPSNADRSTSGFEMMQFVNLHCEKSAFRNTVPSKLQLLNSHLKKPVSSIILPE